MRCCDAGREMYEVLPWPFPDDKFPHSLGAVVQNTVLRGEPLAITKFEYEHEVT